MSASEPVRFTYRSESMIITRRQAAVLHDWLPVWMISAPRDMPDADNLEMQALHEHLVQFFNEEVKH